MTDSRPRHDMRAYLLAVQETVVAASTDASPPSSVLRSELGSSEQMDHVHAQLNPSVVRELATAFSRYGQLRWR